MKKLFVLFLLVGLVALYGCQQAQQATAPTVPVGTCASAVGILANTAVTIDNTALGAVSIIAGVSAKTVSTPTYDGTWWNVTYSLGTDDITFKFKVKTMAGSWVSDVTVLHALHIADVDELVMATSYVSSTMTMTFGTVSSPLTFKGVGLTTATGKSIDGPITLSGTDSDGTSYSVTITYSALSLSASGYPDGNISFSISSGGSVIVAGNLVCDGTVNATLTFTSGYSGSYAVRLDDGTVTVASQ